MRFLERGGRALIAEARQLLAALRDWRLALILGCFAALLLLAAQAPLRYFIAVGQADGPGSDMPLLDGFYPPEHDVHGAFRWTSARALIRLPGVGQRPLQVALRVFPVSPEVAQNGPREIEVWDDERDVLRLPAHPEGAVYRFLLPPPPDGSGDHIVELRSATVRPTGDQRSVGTQVAGIFVASAGGPLLPAWHSTLGWLVIAVLGWLALTRAGLGARGAAALQAVTTNLSMNFLRRPPQRDLLARVRLLKVGRRLAIGEVEIAILDDPELVAHAVATYAMPVD